METRAERGSLWDFKCRDRRSLYMATSCLSAGKKLRWTFIFLLLLCENLETDGVTDKTRWRIQRRGNDCIESGLGGIDWRIWQEEQKLLLDHAVGLRVAQYTHYSEHYLSILFIFALAMTQTNKGFTWPKQEPVHLKPARAAAASW